MKLDKREEDFLSGKRGPHLKTCMEILLAVGECYGAERMIPVTSVHIAGNYPVMMDEGVEWLEALAAEGLKVSVFTTKHPEMFDFEEVNQLNVPEFYRDKQYRIDAALRSMGVTLVYSCHHFLVGNVPRFGEHIAWASSGSQIYANSVIGARSNRDGDHVAICAAITGVIPEWGMHLTENRKGQVIIDVSDIDFSALNYTDWQAMGWQLGKKLGTMTPVFVGLPDDVTNINIRGLLYSMTVTGAPGLAHLVGITPEAPTVEVALGGHSCRDDDSIMVTEKEIEAAYREISTATDEKLDLIIFGCPQCSIQEIGDLASLLEGKKIHPETKLWVCTSNWCKKLSERMKLLETIESAGGKILGDIGAADGPYLYLREQGIRTTAINSARGSYYSHNLFGMSTWFGTMEECVASAISGKWEGRR
jgi:predicted aconitase